MTYFNSWLYLISFTPHGDSLFQCLSWFPIWVLSSRFLTSIHFHFIYTGCDKLDPNSSLNDCGLTFELSLDIRCHNIRHTVRHTCDIHSKLCANLEDKTIVKQFGFASQVIDKTIVEHFGLSNQSQWQNNCPKSLVEIIILITYSGSTHFVR